MYGYLNFNSNKKDSIYLTYRAYYCGLCHALKNNYGLRSAILLSYDITFLSIIIAQSSESINHVPPKCMIYSKKDKINSEYNSAFWRSMACLTLVLAYTKAYDNLLDVPRSIKSRISMLIIDWITKRAQKDNPELFIYAKRKMSEINKAELSGCNVEIQGELTAQMVCDILNKYTTCKLENGTALLISGIMKWLCLIDSIDDYSKDYLIEVRTHLVKNPLRYSYNKSNILHDSQDPSLSSFKSLFCHNSQYLFSIYHSIMVTMVTSIASDSKNTEETSIIKLMIYEQMPKQFYNVMKEQTKNG